MGNLSAHVLVDAKEGNLKPPMLRKVCRRLVEFFGYVEDLIEEGQARSRPSRLTYLAGGDRCGVRRGGGRREPARTAARCASERNSLSGRDRFKRRQSDQAK